MNAMKGARSRFVKSCVYAGFLSLASCRKPTPSSSLRIAHESEALSLDPMAVSEVATHSILSNMCEGIAGFDRNMALVPGLGVNWKNLDERTWLIELRKNVLFHDGTKMTARVVKEILTRIRNDPKSDLRTRLSTVSDVEAVDDFHLKLSTVKPDPLLMNALSDLLIGWAVRGPEGSIRTVGTGPYRFVRSEKGRFLDVEAFPEYWGPRPSISRVRFIPVEEGEGSIQALKERRADVLRFVPEPLADRLIGDHELRVVRRVGLGSYYLWFNAEPQAGRNPFADSRVRRAISSALDRHAIVKRLSGFGVPSNQLVQNGIFGSISGLPELSFDPKRARSLLAEAGYPAGFSTVMSHRRGASMAPVAEAIRGMLADVGVGVELQTLDWEFLVSEWKQARLPMFLSGWSFDNGDAMSFLIDCLATRDPARRVGLFNPGFSSPALDRMIEAQTNAFGDAERLDQYDKLMRAAMEEMPLVPLFTRTYAFGVSQKVVWQPRLDGELRAIEMSLKP